MLQGLREGRRPSGGGHHWVVPLKGSGLVPGPFLSLLPLSLLPGHHDVSGPAPCTLCHDAPALGSETKD